VTRSRCDPWAEPRAALGSRVAEQFAVHRATLCRSLAARRQNGGSLAHHDLDVSRTWLIGHAAKDCPIAMGTLMICSTQDPSGGKWYQGYCTLACDAKNPQCPPNSKCVDSFCMKGCGTDADCRIGYECAGSVCYPKEVTVWGCDVTCNGCCTLFTSQCSPGNTNTACGDRDGACLECSSVEQCTPDTYGHQCQCKSNCAGGCCDSTTGACLPGTADKACGDFNHECRDCTTTGQTCGYDSTYGLTTCI